MPFVQHAGLRLAYIRRTNPDAGSWDRSDCIVLVHGLAANMGFWYFHILPALAAAATVVAFDLRGHGRSSIAPTGYTAESMADDLHAIIDHLGLRSVHLVGHSYGGVVALHYAQKNTERVASLTLADVRLRTLQPRLNTANWAAWPRYKALLERVGISLDDSAGEFGVDLLEQLARLRIEQPLLAERLRHLMPTPFSGPGGGQSARQWLRLLEQTSARSDFVNSEQLNLERLARAKLSVLLVYGEHSQALPTAHRLTEVLDNAALKVIPRVGHFFPLSYPKGLLDAYWSFQNARLGHEQRPALGGWSVPRLPALPPAADGTDDGGPAE